MEERKLAMIKGWFPELPVETVEVLVDNGLKPDQLAEIAGMVLAFKPFVSGLTLDGVIANGKDTVECVIEHRKRWHVFFSCYGPLFRPFFAKDVHKHVKFVNVRSVDDGHLAMNIRLNDDFVSKFVEKNPSMTPETKEHIIDRACAAIYAAGNVIAVSFTPVAIGPIEKEVADYLCSVVCSYYLTFDRAGDNYVVITFDMHEWDNSHYSGRDVCLSIGDRVRTVFRSANRLYLDKIIDLVFCNFPRGFTGDKMLEAVRTAYAIHGVAALLRMCNDPEIVSFLSVGEGKSVATTRVLQKSYLHACYHVLRSVDGSLPEQPPEIIDYDKAMVSRRKKSSTVADGKVKLVSDLVSDAIWRRQASVIVPYSMVELNDVLRDIEKCTPFEPTLRPLRSDSAATELLICF